MTLEEDLERELRSNSSLDRVEALIRSGVDINCTLENSLTFLNLAVIRNRLDVVQLLVNAGANVNPIQVSIGDNYSDFDGYLFSSEEEYHTSSSIGIAAGHGFQEIFDFLAPLTIPEERKLATSELPRGIRQRARIEEWHDDFVKAAAKRYLQDVQALITAGANINTSGPNGCTLIWTAAHNGHVESIQTLINAGADVNIKNRTDGWSPLMIAAGTHQAWSEGTREGWGEDRSRQIEVVHLLIEADANIDATANNGQTPLMEAAKSGSPEMVEVLLQAGADVNARDNFGMSSLAYAQQAEFAEVAQRLQALGATQV